MYLSKVTVVQSMLYEEYSYVPRFINTYYKQIGVGNNTDNKMRHFWR